MNKLFRSAIVLFFIVLSSAAHCLEVVVPEENSPAHDPRQQYFIELLEGIFQEMKTPLKIIYTKIPLLQGRALELMKSDDTGISLTWTMTSEQRELQARPIRIPLLKGLLGARVCLVSRGEENISKLESKVIVQGHDWPDTDILKKNGWKVETATHYRSLFEMVRKKRADCFLRSVTEVQKELKDPLSEGLSLEKNHLIYYPAPMYFFVGKHNIFLSQLIENGLNQMMANGTFDKIFLKHYGEGLNDTLLNIKNRKIVRLSNPYLPKATPIRNSKLWYSFDMQK